MLNRNGEIGHPCLAPQREGFRLSTVEDGIGCGLVIRSFCYVEITLVRVFVMNGCGSRTFWLCWHGASRWLICVCWAFLVDLGWPHVVMAYVLLHVLLDSGPQYFVENFYICVYQRCRPVIFFSGSVGFGIWVMLSCPWEYSLLFSLWSSLRRISTSSLCISRFSWWNRLVVDFCLYRAFWWQVLCCFQWSLCSNYLFLWDSVLVGHVFLESCLFF